MPVPQLLQRHITARDINPSPYSVKAGTCQNEEKLSLLLSPDPREPELLSPHSEIAEVIEFKTFSYLEL